MRYRDLINKEVYCEGLRVGRVTDIIIDGETWKLTHLELELRKEAAKDCLERKHHLKIY